MINDCAGFKAGDNTISTWPHPCDLTISSEMLVVSEWALEVAEVPGLMHLKQYSGDCSDSVQDLHMAFFPLELLGNPSQFGAQLTLYL